MGATYSVLEQSFPEATWSVNEIPDLAGKVILVTGAFSDINICVHVCMLNVSSFVGGNAGRWRRKGNRKGEHTTPLPIARAHRYPATSHYLAVRSAPKAIEAIAELEDETGKLAISYS